MSNSNTNLQTQSSNALHNAIMEAGSKDRPPMLAPSNYAEKIVPVAEGSSETTTESSYFNYNQNGKDACKDAQTMWNRIKRLIQVEDGESLTSVYERFSTLINVMDRNKVTSLEISINTKFLNSLQPEWSKYVTLCRQKYILEEAHFDVFYDYMSQFEPHVKASKAKKAARNHDPLALVANLQASSLYSCSTQPYHVIHPSSVIDKLITPKLYMFLAALFVYLLSFLVNFCHFLDIFENYNPMDDEPMWAADRVIAPTLGSAITIPETANEFTIKVLNVAAGGIFLYKTPNQAYQLLEDKVLLKLDWAKNQKTKSSLKKTVAFADEGSSNYDIDKIIERMDAMTMKMDAQFADKQSTRPFGSLPSNTQPNPKGSSSKPYQPPQARNEHVNAVFTRSGKSYDSPINPNDQPNDSETPINFDSDDEDEEPTPQPKVKK
ncbi:hypothetical protein Tco_0899041 [Tanacetum coccineum]